jgi:hypothetical protein
VVGCILVAIGLNLTIRREGYPRKFAAFLTYRSSMTSHETPFATFQDRCIQPRISTQRTYLLRATLLLDGKPGAFEPRHPSSQIPLAPTSAEEIFG